MCYCCEEPATKKLVIEPSGDMFVYCCNSDACSNHIKKLMTENKFNEDIEEAEFMNSHQGRSRKKYETSVKINMVCIISLGVILTGFALYRILHMCGIC